MSVIEGATDKWIPRFLGIYLSVQWRRNCLSNTDKEDRASIGLVFFARGTHEVDHCVVQSGVNQQTPQITVTRPGGLSWMVL